MTLPRLAGLVGLVLALASAATAEVRLPNAVMRDGFAYAVVEYINRGERRLERVTIQCKALDADGQTINVGHGMLYDGTSGDLSPGHVNTVRIAVDLLGGVGHSIDCAVIGTR